MSASVPHRYTKLHRVAARVDPTEARDSPANQGQKDSVKGGEAYRSLEGANSPWPMPAGRWKITLPVPLPGRPPASSSPLLARLLSQRMRSGNCIWSYQAYRSAVSGLWRARRAEEDAAQSPVRQRACPPKGIVVRRSSRASPGYGQCSASSQASCARAAADGRMGCGRRERIVASRPSRR
jgi:hypothetical protein